MPATASTFLSLVVILSCTACVFPDNTPTAADEPVKLTSGKVLFEKNCASCHNGRVAKAPPITMLNIMSASSSFRAMETGIMRSQAAHLSSTERQAIAEYLAGQALGDDSDSATLNHCEGDAGNFDYDAQPDAQGWGVTLDNQRYFDESIAGLSAQNVPGLELKWSFAFPDANRARSQPSTAAGALFVGSQNGTVYALDQETGCVRWTFSTVAEVRTGIVVAPWDPDDRKSLSYFGDLVGNVYAVNTFTGELAWRDRPDDHPSLTITATPVLFDGQLFVPLSSLEVTEAADPTYECCTFRGGIAVYDAASGKKKWTGYTIDTAPQVVGKNAVGTAMIAPSGAPVWGTPTLDRKRGVIYVGTGSNYSTPAGDTSDAILALSMSDGSIVWKQQMTAGDAWNMGCEAEDKSNCPPENGPDYDFGAATILARNAEGREIILAGQKSGEVFALDPDQKGRVLWKQKLGRGGIQGGVHFGMAVDGDVLYVPMSDFYGGPRWPGTPKPGMYALDITTGKQHWFTPAEDVCAGRDSCDPGLSAAATAIPGAVIAGAMDGHLRAYDRKTGSVLWDFDTAREFTAVSGVTAQGGTIGGGAGAVFKNGRLFINSGYGIYYHMPGNVLLAFGLVDTASQEE
ncbi:MAG: PQQ-binding-like beta-propeller repeat protein [Pseudomonadales bacterium]